jgi:small subunit ribosomal protein S6
MSKYESVYIARQDFSTAQVEGLNEKLNEILVGLGATVAKTEYWGLRSLTYRVKKNRKGHYTLFQIDADKDAIAEYERQMRFNEDVLRNRDERGSRGPRRSGPRQ